jgi:thiamine biosynthesis lipoprotein
VEEQLSPAAPEPALATVTFEAFGGLAVAAVTDPRELAGARRAVERVVAEFDLACSRFRPDSELTAVNERSGSWVPVSPLFIQATAAALRAAELTDGDVDPTVGEALIALGYDRDFSELARAPRATPRVRISRVPGWRTVQVDPHGGRVRLSRGVRLDLGATAKALAADRAADAAAGAAGCGTLVSLSGDLATAGPPPERGWPVRVTDDHRADLRAPGQWVTVSSGGLATSSTTVRRWQTGSGVAHHLVDPATGRSVESPWRTVTVTAASCLEANIASTAAIIRGRQAEGWLAAQGLPSRLVTADGRVMHLAGWPIGGDDLPPALAEASVPETV